MHEIVQLDPVRTGGLPDEPKGLVDPEPVTLGDDALRLLDRNARLEGLLELCSPLVGRLRHCEKSPDRRGGLVGRPPGEGFDCLEVCLLVVHGG